MSGKSVYPLPVPTFNHYLIDAARQWLIDCNKKVHITIDAQQITDGKLLQYVDSETHCITLNVSPGAVKDYLIDKFYMTFNTRFNTIDYYIKIPISAILSVYSHNPGDGMMIHIPPMPLIVEADEPPPPPKSTTSKVVKLESVKRNK